MRLSRRSAPRSPARSSIRLLTRVVLCFVTCVAAATARAQGRGVCVGGGTGHARVAPRVDAVFVYERCLGGDRLAAVTLWRARSAGWEAVPDSVAFDQRGRVLVVHARDGAHPISLGRTDSVMVVMLDWVDAVAGPIPLTATRLRPVAAAGLVPGVAEMREAERRGSAAPTRDVSNRLRTLLMLDGRSRRFIGE